VNRRSLRPVASSPPLWSSRRRRRLRQQRTAHADLRRENTGPDAARHLRDADADRHLRDADAEREQDRHARRHFHAAADAETVSLAYAEGVPLAQRVTDATVSAGPTSPAAFCTGSASNQASS